MKYKVLVETEMKNQKSVYLELEFEMPDDAKAEDIDETALCEIGKAVIKRTLEKERNNRRAKL